MLFIVFFLFHGGANFPAWVWTWHIPSFSLFPVTCSDS
jgi:hypothetical protein